MIIEINQYDNNFETTSKKDSQSTLAPTIECAEQNGFAEIVSYLKSVRLTKYLEDMRTIDFRKENALNELKELTHSITKLIESNRGGSTGIHGFIGERAHVYLSNAWSIINGDVKICELIDDNGMTDYFEKGIPIQQKACKSNGLLGLDYVLKHHKKYPNFTGKYQIPKDFYSEYERLSKLNQYEAGHLSLHEWNMWLEIQEVEADGITIEPMKVTYDEIQKNKIYNTIDNHRNGINAEAGRQAEAAYEAHKPTVEACIKATAASATIESVMTGAVKVLEKHRNGKHIKNYDIQDIKDVGFATAEGAVKGAVRGSVIYLTENLTPIPGFVAGAAVTVAFDSAKTAYEYSKGKKSKKDCIRSIGKSTLTATVGALGSEIGGKISPVPIVGEIIGGFVFSFLADKSFNCIVNHFETKQKT